MKDLEDLLMTRNRYLLKIRYLESSVIHNRRSRAQIEHYTTCLNKVETQIKDLLDKHEL